TSARSYLQQSTNISRLSNGLTIATEYIPNTPTATVGIYVDAGSRAENTKNNGTAHFLEHLAFKGTEKRSQKKIELDIENIGSHLNAYTSRENTVYYAKTLKENVPQAIDILSDILTKSTLDKSAIERERDVIIRESEEVDKMYDEVVFDHLHEIAYSDQSLGRTILGPIKNIKSITRDDLKNYITQNYKGDRMVLASAGDIDHNEIVKYAEKYFGHLPSSHLQNIDTGLKRSNENFPIFHRGERFLKNLTLQTTHIAIALEGVSWSSPDYFIALATQAIVGNWDRSLGAGTNSPSPLAVGASGMANNSQPLANSYMSFSTSYADSGLWGMYIVTDSKEHNPKLIIDQVLNEWKRIKLGNFTDSEVSRAKSQLKAALLLSLDGSTPIVEDIGRQIITTGKRLSPEEVFEKVDKITKEDIKIWANYRLNDKPISIVALGNVENVPTLSYIEQNLQN
ncbi:hypothetical protein Kpol_1024p23, partial [Vanderwaltozyma polyspora DSM 70294]